MYNAREAEGEVRIKKKTTVEQTTFYYLSHRFLTRSHLKKAQKLNLIHFSNFKQVVRAHWTRISSGWIFLVVILLSYLLIVFILLSKIYNSGDQFCRSALNVVFSSKYRG